MSYRQVARQRMHHMILIQGYFKQPTKHADKLTGTKRGVAINKNVKATHKFSHKMWRAESQVSWNFVFERREKRASAQFRRLPVETKRFSFF